jgi:hypothetical protein
MKRAILQLLLVFGLLSGSVGAYGVTSTYTDPDGVGGNPGTWDNGAPTDNTAAIDFVVASGDVTIAYPYVEMKSLNIQNGAICSLSTNDVKIWQNLTISGDLNNTVRTTLEGLIISSTGRILTNSSRFYINNTMEIGGSFPKATSANSYALNTSDPGNSRTLKIKKSGVILTDIIYSGSTPSYLDKVFISNSGSLTIDVSTNVNTKIDMQGGDLIVDAALTTLNLTGTSGTNNITYSSTPTTLTVSGTGAAVNIYDGTTTITPTLVATGKIVTVDGSSSILRINNSATNVLGTLNITAHGTFEAQGSPRLDISNMGDINGSLLLTTGTNINTTFPASLTLNGTSSFIDHLNNSTPIPVSIKGTGGTITNSAISSLTFVAGTTNVSLGSGNSIANITVGSGATAYITGTNTISSTTSLSGGILNVNAPLTVNTLTISGSNTIGGSDVLTLNNSVNFPSTSSTTLAASLNAAGKTITIDGSGVLQANSSAAKSISIGTLTLTGGGTFSSTASGTLTLDIPIVSTISGSLLLNSNTSLGSFPVALTLSGNGSAISYINKPAVDVTVSSTGNSISHCYLNSITVGSGSSISSLGTTSVNTITANGGISLNGAVRVATTLDVAAGITLASGAGNLTMLDQANFYFTPTTTITGTVNIHRKYGSNGWVLFGSPFGGENIGSITAQTVVGKKYVEDIRSPRWVKLTNSDVFVRGRGYQLGMLAAVTQDTVVFTGTPDLSAVNVTGLTFTLQGDYSSQCGYNLVSNPYTAPIDIALFFTANPNITEIKQWDVAPSGAGNGQFITRSRSNVISPLTTLKNENQSKINSSYFAPNQGFFVKLPASGTNSVAFTSGQITRNPNDNFLKSASIDYLRLYLKSSSGSQTDCVIQFNDASSDAYNAAFDAGKLLSTGVSDVYTYKGPEMLAIQVRPTISKDLVVPIGLANIAAGSQTFSISNFDALPAGVNVYIKDSVTNTTVNLRETTYTVALPAGAINNRFKLLFTNGASSSASKSTVSLSNNNVVNFTSELSRVYANFDQELKNVKIQVVDMTGRVISENSYSNVIGKIAVGRSFEKNRIYTIRLSSKACNKTSKIVVQ